jgi:hypothetical protein
MRQYAVPEVARVPLEELVLQVSKFLEVGYVKAYIWLHQCLTSYTFQASMRQYVVPEVARVPLEELVLQVSKFLEVGYVKADIWLHQCLTSYMFQASMRQYAVPEVARVPLEELVRQVSKAHTSMAAPVFKWLHVSGQHEAVRGARGGSRTPGGAGAAGQYCLYFGASPWLQYL